MPIRVEIELEDGTFTSRMIHAGETVQQFQSNVGGAVRSVTSFNESSQGLLGTMRDVAVTLGMARIALDGLRDVMSGWVGDIIRVNGEMERLQHLLAGMSRAADPMKDAASQVKFLRDFAKDAPFSLAALSDTFVKMKSTGIDPMSGALKGLVDGIAAFGGTDETLKRATIALQQMSGKGVIQMEELRQQLGEAVPRAVELMARSMGLSTGQLIQEISKGTLDAKTSLAAFTLELDRTFGGAAAAQMETFNGMVSKTSTLMQNLALNMGSSGLFDAVKNQIKQLIGALQSTQFEAFARQAGSLLAGLVNTIGSSIGTIIKFRDEILFAGEAIGVAFAASKFAAIGVSFGNLAEAMGASWRRIRIQQSLMTASLVGSGGMIASVTTAKEAWLAFTLTLSGVGTAATKILPLLGAVLAFVSEFALPLTLIGAAMYGLYVAFLRTSDGAKEAYDSLDKFGTKTKEQIDLARQHVAQLEAQAKALHDLKAAQESGANAANGVGDALFPVTDKDINNADSAARTAAQKTAAADAQRLKDAGEKFAEAQDEILRARLAKLKASYDQEGIADADFHKDELKRLQDAHKDTTAETTRYQDDRRQKALDFYQKQEDDAKAQLVDLQMLANSGDEAANAGLEKRMQTLLAYIRDRQQAFETLSSQQKGPVELDKGINVTKLLEQAKTKLDGLNGDIAAQKAELEGVSGEYARMAYLIQDAVAKSDGMWKLDNPLVQAVVKQLQDAQKETDTLQQKLTGLKALDTDIEGAYRDAQQKYIEELTHGKTGIDAIAAKQQAGLYSGKSSIARMLDEVKGSAEGAGKAMDTALGSGMEQKGSGLVAVVERLGNAWKAVRDGATGASSVPAPAPRGNFSGGSYADNVIHHESGGRSNASNPNSTATGAGQFIESTWLEFLKEMRPDILAGGTKAALDTRNDADLAKQAVEWYAAKNATKLDKAGVDVNDASLYLAHFLGPDGAIAALTKSSNTLLSAIPQLDTAREKNPNIANMTVQQLKDWAASFMGPLMTASRTGRDTSSLGTALGATTSNGQRGMMLETNDLYDKAAVLAGKNAVEDLKKALAASMQESDDSIDGTHKHLAAVLKTVNDLIAAGKLSGDEWVKGGDKLKTLTDLADKADEADTRRAKNRKIRQEADAIVAKNPQTKQALDEQQADIDRRLTDEVKFGFSDSYYRNMKETLQKIKALEAAEDINPIKKADYEAAIKDLENNLDRARNAEIEKSAIGEKQKQLAAEESLMTTDGLHAEVHRRQVSRLQEEINLIKGNDATAEKARKTLTAAIKTQDQVFKVAGPFAQQMKSWIDITGNLEKATASWLGQFNDQLATAMVTGKAKWSDLAQTIEKDIAKIALQWMESSVFKWLTGSAIGGGGGKSVAAHHSGGMVGTVSPARQVNPMMFAGAPKFHSGSGGMTLGGDEVPIIAKKGEMVDWPSNLARMFGGGGGTTIAPTIAVNVQGSAGMSAADHQRMGEKVGAAAMNHIRDMIGKELRTATRPGGVLRGGRR